MIAQIKRLATVALLYSVSSLVSTHELEADLLTVVLRDANHVSLTFRVDEAGVMHRLLSPRSSDAEFLLPLSAMGDETFAIVVQNFRKRFEQEVQVRDEAQRPILLTGWHWPDITETRQRFRQLAMQGLVGAASHEHLPPTVITVDAVSRTEISRVDLRLPGALEGLTVVHYRPLQQTWRSATRSRLDLKF